MNKFPQELGVYEEEMNKFPQELGVYETVKMTLSVDQLDRLSKFLADQASNAKKGEEEKIELVFERIQSGIFAMARVGEDWKVKLLSNFPYDD